MMKRTAALASAAAVLAAPLVAGTGHAAPADPATGQQKGHSRVNPSLTNRFASPLVISHRGASGYRPEHTLAAYELAVQQGADYIEPDLVMTKDGVLVDRHENNITGTTDVSTRAEFAGRKTTKVIDGATETGWFTQDFTLAELKTLRAVERLPYRTESHTYDGKFDVPTFEEDLQFREYLSKKYGREIGIIPEIKHSTYHHSLGMNPEVELVRLTKKYKLNRPNAPMFVQSFELTNLQTLRRELGYKANLAFLTTVNGGPFDLRPQGVTYAQLTTADSLKTLAKDINALGPEKNAVIARKTDGTLGAETGLVGRAHAAGLVVTPWTFRSENTFLPVDYRIGTEIGANGRMADEAVRFMEAGVDGLFCDQPDVCVKARNTFLAQN
ncbi:glycerophosphodiester phosphodiesterase family protein [Kribbia dieselivorans]|uniref:glycerophosphodiester phosphodiesterase family protein n=1 Tax=Kribbia dieselivorans TaxID=331526 RepID=UPI000AA60C10|nr:glycerophosphodiester phosphodiesterase family protein [Kribbia dieselivorans]